MILPQKKNVLLQQGHRRRLHSKRQQQATRTTASGEPIPGEVCPPQHRLQSTGALAANGSRPAVSVVDGFIDD
jgi:hypothetical protein